jgi:uncharacterized protein YjbI with pentapeptide repeats
LAPFGAVYLVLLGLGTVGALAVYLLLLAFVPGASGTRLDAMKTALLVVAGSGAGAGLYVQYRKQQTDEAKSALDHANSRRDQDKLFTERYTQAVAQLGNPAAAVRLGGVYALARIADDSVRDRPTCLEVLCAYLRMPYDPDDPDTEPAERQVRTTAQSAIAARLRPDHPGFWADAQVNLADAYLIEPQFDNITVDSFTATRATFSGDAKFGEATFSGEAHFGKATFSREAHFGEATFSREAWFGEATFSREAWFGEATFSGDAWFGKARFDAAAGFSEATFGGDAGFSEAKFSGYTGFRRAAFVGNAWFVGAAFGGHAGLVKTRFWRDPPPGWAQAFGKEAEFVEARFSRDAQFVEARFSGYARFVGTAFSRDAWFDKATFDESAWFVEAAFGGHAGFVEARFRRDRPPQWPQGFVEPAGIVWVDPPALAPDPAGPDPDPPADPVDPPNLP